MGKAQRHEGLVHLGISEDYTGTGFVKVRSQAWGMRLEKRAAP